MDLLKRKIFETGLRVDALHGELRREREALANCQACFDTFKVPIDGYKSEESRDPSERFKRTCRLCEIVERESYQIEVRSIRPVFPRVISRFRGLFFLLLCIGLLLLMLLTE